MEITTFAAQICQELRETLLGIPEAQARAFYELVLSKRERTVFVCGAGRCQYMLRAFCMRLMHLGFRAHVVGDTATPAVEKDDLVIFADGAGHLTTITETARLAKGHGARVAVLTILPDSPLAGYGDLLVLIPGRTAAHGGVGRSIQPGGGKYEQCLLIFLDAVVAALVEEFNLPKDAAFVRHANLE